MERRRKALLCYLHLRSLRNDAVLGVTPERDEKLAGQCYDHDPLDSATGLPDSLAEPSRQGAVGLPAQPQPGEFHHRRSHASVAVLADPLLALVAPAGEWRPGKPGMGAERAPVGDRPRESLAHEKCREFGTDGPHVHKRADHAFRLVGGCRLFQNSIARRFDLLDLPQGQFESIEETFDPNSRGLRDGVAIRLPQRGKLLATVTPQSPVALHAEGRQNAVNFVQDREAFAGQILAFAMSPARFFIGLGWNWNHRTDARLSAEPGHQRAQQHLDVDDIRLRPPRPTIHGKARRLHHMDFDAEPETAPTKIRRDPPHGSKSPAQLDDLPRRSGLSGVRSMRPVLCRSLPKHAACGA